MRALVTGATGFVGRRLALALRERGDEVRCLVRTPAKARGLEAAGCELVQGDVLREETLRGAGAGVDVAYYLVHSMGRGGKGDFEEHDRRAARTFARAMKADGVARIAYLGGLGGDQPLSKHLRSRHETALVLGEEGPPLSYFRAAMVVGPESESFRTLKHLVARLPVMIAPRWLQTPTQPIAIDDVVAFLSRTADAPAREIQIGGPDILSYGDCLDVMAHALGKRPRPKIPVPLLSPTLSSHWIGLVTPVDAAVARPLVEGLSTPTIVTDASGMALFADVRPKPLEQALREALAT